MPDTLADIINKPQNSPSRRAYIRRKLLTGLYESTWQPITSYVRRWGSIDSSVDDVRLNKFAFSGINLQVDNRTGYFNPEANSSSAWYGYLTRHGTLVKIQAGYTRSDETELPTDTSQGIFIIDQEIPISSENTEINLRAASLKSIFDREKAVDVVGLNSTLTASEIVTKIKNHTDGSANFIFQQYISGGAWNIQATTNNYLLDTLTSLQDVDSVWELMEQLAECEGFVVYIDRFGEFVFEDRTPSTVTSMFSFYGQGFKNQNIIRIDSYKEALNKVYTFFKFKYLEPDTSTSYVTAGTVTTISPTNEAWKYGAKVYEMENRLVPLTATAQTIINGAWTNFSAVKNELEMTTKMHPSLDILDRVDLNYYSYNLAGKTLWDTFDWDGADWSGEKDMFDWDSKQTKILAKRLDLDNFTHSWTMREI